MDCSVCSATGELWLKQGGGGRMAGGGGVGEVGGFSHESEHDLAALVTDFLENGSGGVDSLCSSDSDSGFCDLAHLADKISHHKLLLDQYGIDLLSVINSLVLSIKSLDLQLVRSGPCNGSCIRYYLVKLLRLSGCDAAVCSSRWQGTGKVPGAGDYEYIDVVNYNDNGTSERLIVDINFRSHFEIARAVSSYERILRSLPVVYVGSLTKLNHFLKVMAEAAKSSLKQNSMPLPPWRPLAYYQAKWQSPYQRRFNHDQKEFNGPGSRDHEQCVGHLKRLQSLLQSEAEIEQLLRPLGVESSRRQKLDRWRCSLYRNS